MTRERPGRDEPQEDIFDVAYGLERRRRAEAGGGAPRPASAAALAEVSRDFDPDHYRRQNPDVAALGTDPLEHFVRHGWKEERAPSATLTARDLVRTRPEARRILVEQCYHGRPRRRFGLPFGRHPPDGPTPPPLGPPSRRRRGALLTGYLEAGLGLGESARGLARALDEAGQPFGLFPYNRRVRHRHVGPFMPGRTDLRSAYDVNIVEVALEQLPEALADLGPARTAASYNVLRTYWELARIPDAWRGHLAGIDEVWAPTRFVAEAFREVFEGPLTLVPPVVTVDAPHRSGRSRFGLAADRFLVLATFDYSSNPARKNPLGAVAAFQAAFPDPGEPATFVVKSTGAPDLCLPMRAAVAEAARRDPRIVVIDRSLSRPEMVSLLAGCDAYLSLHRSEGFGLGMAEAMALGRPVIGTDYSGSRDFLTPEHGYPVACGLRPLGPGEYLQGDGQSWAEPDLDAAAAALREVFRDPAGSRIRAAAGQRFVAARFGPAPVGRLARDRLAEIAASRRPPSRLFARLGGGR